MVKKILTNNSKTSEKKDIFFEKNNEIKFVCATQRLVFDKKSKSFK